MKFRLHIINVIILIFIVVWSISIAHSAWYPCGIQYRQAITKILKRGDITWGGESDDEYKFGSVLVSADGSKVLLTGKCEYCSPAEVRPFLFNPDGTGKQDLYSMLPADMPDRWSSWKNLIINDDASKIFFRAVKEVGYYDDEYLYIYNVASSTRQLAVNQKFGVFDSTWHFRINETGSRVYLDKYDGGYSSSLGRNMKGLFYADTGSTKQWYFDLYSLPCNSECYNMNMFAFMGSSFLNDRAFFTWNSDYWSTDGSNQHKGLYHTGLDGNATRLGEEHYYVDYGADWRGICNSEGTRVIYGYKHQSGDTLKLGVVNVPSGTETVVGWTSGLNGFDSHMTRSGRYILVKGEYGDYGTYYQTMVDLTAGASRDTWSYFLPTQWGSTSNVTEDDRYYFHSIDGSEAVAGVYRIDMKTTGDAKAPHVQSIEFSAPALYHQDGVKIAVQVRITDPQGTGNIEWAKLTPLVEGQETPPWSMGREPLAFPTGDAGSTLLYDDGTHGDVTPDDGFFTFDSIATRKGDYDGFNTWYNHYTLPAKVGIRIIVKDNDNNYAIADTELTIMGPAYYVDPSGSCNGYTPCYDTIQAAIDAAVSGAVILVKQGTYPESISLGTAKTILVKGGYNSTYDQQTANKTFIQAPGQTTIQAPSGALTFQMITIKP